MTEHKFKLGERLRDEITGIEGVATARYEFLTSCEQYSLEFINKDGVIQYHSFDYTRLKKIKEAVIPPGLVEANLQATIPPRAAG